MSKSGNNKILSGLVTLRGYATILVFVFVLYCIVSGMVWLKGVKPCDSGTSMSVVTYTWFLLHKHTSRGQLHVYSFHKLLANEAP